VDPEENIPSAVESVFDSFKFRSDFIEDVEIRKAFSFGRARGLKTLGVEQGIIEAKDESCDMCLEHIGDIVETGSILLSDVPPYHNACDCSLKSYMPKSDISDSIDETLDHDKTKIGDKRSARMNNCIQRIVPKLKRDNPELGQSDLKTFAEAVCRGKFDN
ncbi:MAG: hypothetical protein DRP42_05110, partial [Tenericutes bacterium]